MTKRQKTAQNGKGCRSMTGFALARAQHDGWNLRVSLKSVNHRFLDVKLRLPEGFDLYEMATRQAVRDRMVRGHVEVTVEIRPSTAAPLQINSELARAYLKAAEGLRGAGPKGELDVVALLRLPGVVMGVTPEAPETDEERERFGAALSHCLGEALGKLEEMRSAEGHHLAEDMQARAEQIGQQAAQIRELAQGLRPAFHRRLESRLTELLSETGLDPARVVQEAAMLAERSDVSEELDRLRSHLAQFAKLLAGGGEVGKKLDFLLQEMHREANTLLSKTPGVESEGLAITGLALEIKAEIEKLREQVQNIE